MPQGQCAVRPTGCPTAAAACACALRASILVTIHGNWQCLPDLVETSLPERVWVRQLVPSNLAQEIRDQLEIALGGVVGVGDLHPEMVQAEWINV